MDDWYLWAMAAVAVIVTLLAWRVPRAARWMAIGALSFLTSGWWHDAGLPYGAAFGAFTNFVVIAAISAKAVLLYELIIWVCFDVMLLIDALFLLNIISSHSYFAIGLELANWVALFSIGAAGMADRAGIGRRTWLRVFRASPVWPSALNARVVSALAHLAGPSAAP